LKLYDYFQSMRKTAVALGISVSTICRWTKEIQIKTRKRQKTKMTEVLVAFVKNLIVQDPTITCTKIVKTIHTSMDMIVSRQLVHLILRKLDYTYKRVRKRGKSAQKETKVQDFIKTFMALSGQTTIVSVDESGFDHRCVPIYGYSPRGTQTVLEYKPSNNRKRYNLLMAITNTNEHVTKVMDVNVTSEPFADFIDRLDVPTGSVILLDNASIHRTDLVRKVAARKEFLLLYTPPYSPEFNPIEMVFGILKNSYYKMRYTTEDTIPEMIAKCIRNLSKDMYGRMFRHVQQVCLEKKIETTS